MRKPEVSIDPTIVNNHLLAANLRNGLVLNGAVLSIEEKGWDIFFNSNSLTFLGAVVDLGLQSKFNGFVANEDLPPYMSRLKVGQVLLFRVKRDPGESSRVIRLSAYAEMDTLEDEKLTTIGLMPGTIVHASPEKVVGDGVFVGLNNGR